MNLNKEEIRQGIRLCVESLNQEDQRESHGKIVATIIGKLFEQPYQGRGLGIGGFGYRDFRSDWESKRIYYQGKETIRKHRLDWLDAFLVLVDAYNSPEEEILSFAKEIEDNIMFNHVLKHLITNCVVTNDPDKAKQFIPHFRETNIFKKEDNKDSGYLILLKYYALQGDDKSFFKHFKLAKPAKNRTDVSDCKAWLVQAYSQKNTLNDALKLCNHKNLGKKYYHSALLPFAEKGRYQDLKTKMKEHPELSQLEQGTEPMLLVKAYKVAKEKNLPIEDDFEVLFSACLKVDRKIKFGDIKLQDALLLDLGLASKGNKERVLKCRKAIKDNRVKRELVLP
ncbi:MAG: hypothetical protein ACFB0B_03880 [Thermonemataceae bacterium]